MICRAQEIEKRLAAEKHDLVEHGINALDELRNKRFQAEDVMRTTDYESGSTSVDFCSIVRQIASDLEHEIEECEKNHCVEQKDTS